MMYSMASYICLDLVRNLQILLSCSTCSQSIEVRLKNWFPKSLMASIYLWVKDTSWLILASLTPSKLLSLYSMPLYSDLMSLSMIPLTNLISSIRYSSLPHPKNTCAIVQLSYPFCQLDLTWLLLRDRKLWTCMRQWSSKFYATTLNLFIHDCYVARRLYTGCTLVLRMFHNSK